MPYNCHHVPSLSHRRGVHLAKFTPFSPHIDKNCLEKNVSVALRGAPAPLGYAYSNHPVGLCWHQTLSLCSVITEIPLRARLHPGPDGEYSPGSLYTGVRGKEGHRGKTERKRKMEKRKGAVACLAPSLLNSSSLFCFVFSFTFCLIRVNKYSAFYSAFRLQR